MRLEERLWSRVPVDVLRRLLGIGEEELTYEVDVVDWRELEEREKQRLQEDTRQMTILDTSIIIDLVKARKPVHDDDITVVTYVEYPKIVYYKGFHGGIIFPTTEAYTIAHKLQLRLMEQGRPQQFSDLPAAAIAVAECETLVTRDKDFQAIGEAARQLGYNLKLQLVK